MAACPRCGGDLTVVGSDDRATILYSGPFIFSVGNLMRAFGCLVCGKPIGDQAAAVIGAAGLERPVCLVSCIPADAWLAHEHCLPDDLDQIQEIIGRGLQCTADHPWLH